MSVHRAALGPAFDRLPPIVAAFHDGRGGLWRGRVDVECGRGPRAALALRLGGFPPAGRDVALRVRVRAAGDGETWERRFGENHVTISALRPIPGGVVERFGPVACRLRLAVEGGALVGRVAGARLGLVPLPRGLVPDGGSREWGDAEGRYRFDVGAGLPGGGLLIRYHGWLRRDPAP